MKFIILIITFSYVFMSCNIKSVTEEKKLSPIENEFIKKKISLDTSLYKLDTTINNVLITNNKFKIEVLKDKFDQNLKRFSELYDSHLESSPTTINIISEVSNELLYTKKFDQISDVIRGSAYSFFKGQQQALDKEGMLYLKLVASGGGSGYIKKIYKVTYKDNRIDISALSTGGELSFEAYSKKENEIIILDGVWNSSENETHFDDHRYKIIKYTDNDHGFREDNLGQTLFKYSSDKPTEEILSDIFNKEPLLFPGVNFPDYINKMSLLKNNMASVTANLKNESNQSNYGQSNSSNIFFSDKQSVSNYLQGKTFYSSDGSARIKINNMININGQDTHFNLSFTVLNATTGVVIGESLSNPNGTIKIYVDPQKGCITNRGDTYCTQNN